MPIPIDALTGSELQALDAWHQAAALNDIMAELGRLGELRKKCSNALYDAKIGLLRDSSVDNKELLLRSQAALERIKTEISTRREQARILQSLIRAIPG